MRDTTTGLKFAAGASDASRAAEAVEPSSGRPAYMSPVYQPKPGGCGAESTGAARLVVAL